MKIFQALLLLLLPFLGLSQEGFPGYTVLKSYKGDFNADNKPDKIVVYERPCTESDSLGIDNTNCRRVAIYLRNQSGYALYSYNDNIVECSACGGGGVGDPFQDIKTKNGYFSIESLYGDCDKTLVVITFKYNSTSKEFYLHKTGRIDYNCKEEPVKPKEHTETTKDFGIVKFVDYQ